jgi:hypothetical protein
MHKINIRAAVIAVSASLWQLAAAQGAVPVAAPLITCRLAPHQTVTLVRKDVAGDTAIVAVSTNGQVAQAVFGDEDDASRGSDLKVRCAGTDRSRALILQGEFMGAGYPKGAAWVWNPYNRSVQRIDFAERSFPSQVLLSAQGATLVLPNRSAEQRGRWLTYSQGVKDSEPRVEGVDQVSRTHNRQVIAVGGPKNAP